MVMPYTKVGVVKTGRVGRSRYILKVKPEEQIKCEG